LKLHDSFVFPRTPFDLKEVTPLLSGADIGSTDVGMPQNIARCTDLKITPHCPRPRPARCYKNSSTFTTILCSNPSTVFISCTNLLFALSRFVFHPIFILCRVAFFVRCTYFAFLWFLKWGVTFGLALGSAKPARFRFVFTS
jgi:hypothetical protein